MDHKDWRGTPIEVGSTVIYPVSQGSSSAFVREGKVLEFVEKKDWQGNPQFQARIEVSGSNRSYERSTARPTLVYFSNLTVLPRTVGGWINGKIVCGEPFPLGPKTTDVGVCTKAPRHEGDHGYEEPICTCKYPAVKFRNGSGHAGGCAVHVAWLKRRAERSTSGAEPGTEGA